MPWKERLLYLVKALGDQHVGLEETDDGVWAIYFNTVLIALAECDSDTEAPDNKRSVAVIRQHCGACHQAKGQMRKRGARDIDSPLKAYGAILGTVMVGGTRQQAQRAGTDGVLDAEQRADDREVAFSCATSIRQRQALVTEPTDDAARTEPRDDCTARHRSHASGGEHVG